MFVSHFGEIAALLTAFFWTTTSMVFEVAGKRIGSIFGPFLGVAFSLLAIQNTTTGVASTIMSIVPVLIIPPAIIFLKEKVNLKEIIGAVIAVIGVSILFMV